MGREAYDGIVLVQHSHADWRVPGAAKPLYVCSEMFLALDDIQRRRWRLWRLRNELSGLSLHVAALADFLLPEDIAWLEKTSDFIARSWYFQGDRDLTEYRGISLGRCCEYDIKARSIRLLKFVLTCKRLSEQYPDCPIFCDQETGAIERQLLEQAGIAVKLFDGHVGDATPLNCSGSSSLRASLQSAARQCGLALLQMLSDLVKLTVKADKPLVIVWSNLQSLKVLQVWLELHPKQIRVALWGGRPRTSLQLLKAGATFIDSPAQAVPAFPTEFAAVTEQWGRIAGSARPDLFSHLGMSLQHAFEQLFDKVVQSHFPTVCNMVDHAYRSLEPSEATLLVLPNDCQDRMRAWTLVAARVGTKSLVLQHGHLDYKEDGNHLLADYSAFWSDMVAKEFLAAGLKDSQILVTGAPNSDGGRRFGERRLLPAGHPGAVRVLVITTGNPGVQAYFDEVWVCDYIARVLRDLCDGSGRFEVTVRLHPGESADLYKEHLLPWLPRIRSLTDAGTLDSFLDDCDVVVSPPSTVVLEARAKDIPVVLVPIQSVDNRRSTLEDVQGVVAVRSPQSICSAIERLLLEGTQSEGVDVSHYLGPQDGQSSRRLFRAVQGLAFGGAPDAEPSRTQTL